MALVYRIAAVKHEAETYATQGLCREAAAVYNRFLDDHQDLHPVLKSVIEQCMERIESRSQNRDKNENSKVTEAQVTPDQKGMAKQRHHGGASGQRPGTMRVGLL